MTDLRAALGAQRLAGEKKRHRHRWESVVHEYPDWGMVVDWRCSCGAIKDEAKSRAGRNARKRGNRRELELAKALGGEKVGQYGGPDDVRAGIFSIQSKVRANFPTWMTTELDKLPRTGGRVPVLIVTGPVGSDPHDARKRASIAVVHLSDWRDLHGDDAA